MDKIDQLQSQQDIVNNLKNKIKLEQIEVKTLTNHVQKLDKLKGSDRLKNQNQMVRLQMEEEEQLTQ